MKLILRKCLQKSRAIYHVTTINSDSIVIFSFSLSILASWSSASCWYCNRFCSFTSTASWKGINMFSDWYGLYIMNWITSSCCCRSEICLKWLIMCASFSASLSLSCSACSFLSSPLNVSTLSVLYNDMYKQFLVTLEKHVKMCILVSITQLWLYTLQVTLPAHTCSCT